MNIAVDTCVWSLALRRNLHNLNERERRIVVEWTELVREKRARLIGVVRQELLTGIKAPSQFENLRQITSAFTDEPIESADHEAAAKASNDCIARGIAVSTVDMLICAVALRRGMSIFTTDPDFDIYARVLPLRLHSLPA